jgi:hypothetical protein
MESQPAEVGVSEAFIIVRDNGSTVKRVDPVTMRETDEPAVFRYVEPIIQKRPPVRVPDFKLNWR